MTKNKTLKMSEIASEYRTCFRSNNCCTLTSSSSLLDFSSAGAGEYESSCPICISCSLKSLPDLICWEKVIIPGIGLAIFLKIYYFITSIPRYMVLISAVLSHRLGPKLLIDRTRNVILSCTVVIANSKLTLLIRPMNFLL